MYPSVQNKHTKKVFKIVLMHRKILIWNGKGEKGTLAHLNLYSTAFECLSPTSHLSSQCCGLKTLARIWVSDSGRLSLAYKSDTLINVHTVLKLLQRCGEDGSGLVINELLKLVKVKTVKFTVHSHTITVCVCYFKIFWCLQKASFHLSFCCSNAEGVWWDRVRISKPHTLAQRSYV